MGNTNSPAAIAWEHSEKEFAFDLEGTLATMEEPYFYEVWPMGVRMQGRGNARGFYQRLFQMPFRPNLVWLGKHESADGLVTEFDVTPQGGESRTHRVVAVSVIGPNGRVSGERTYADDDFARFVFGKLLQTKFRPVAQI